MQLRVAEFCEYNRTHSFNFPFVAQKLTRVAQVLEKYDQDSRRGYYWDLAARLYLPNLEYSCRVVGWVNSNCAVTSRNLAFLHYFKSFSLFVGAKNTGKTWQTDYGKPVSILILSFILPSRMFPFQKSQ